MYSLLIWGFPVILLGFESALRFVTHLDFLGFMGPTLAAAGLSNTVATVRPKTKDFVDADGKQYLLTTKMDNQVVAGAWLLLLIMMLMWGVSCYLASNPSGWAVYEIPGHFVIGSVVYIASILMTVLKGRT